MNPLAVFILLIFLTGCGPGDSSPDETFRPDYEVFTTSVQPILVEGCANPSACHGSSTRPFSLYAPGAHRKSSRDTFINSPLTPEEELANYHRTRSFIVDIGGGPLLLIKPLAEEAGGVRHLEGGDLYFSKSERDFRILEAWIGIRNSEVDR